MNSGSPGFVGFLEPSDARWSGALSNVRHDFFHLPGYLHASAGHEGGSAVLLLVDEGDHGMLVPFIKRPLSKYGEPFGDYFDVTSPYGYPGPLYWGQDWEARLPGLHARMDTFLREERVVSLFLRLNPFVGAPDDLLVPLGERVAHGPTVYMDLRDPEQTWMGINEQNRKFISRQLARGFRVVIDAWDTMDTVIEAYYETMTRLNARAFYFFPKDYFLALKEGTAPHFHLATAYGPAGDILGGAFFSEVEGLIHYFLMGTFEQYMDASPSKLLVNALRLWGIEHGHQTLHLGGGSGARMDSLFDFKRRLSKLTVTYSTFRKVLLPDAYRDLVDVACGGDFENDFFPIYRHPRPGQARTGVLSPAEAPGQASS